MDKVEMIRILENNSCYECAFGCVSPVDCVNSSCKYSIVYKEVVQLLKDMEKNKKIKVTEAEIIVGGTKEKPYFNIKYKEVGSEHYNIGYSSYNLNFVFDWLKDCFEIVGEE